MMIGVSHYDGQKWQVYDQIDSMELQVVYAVKIDPDNAVWLGTARGVAHFDGERWIAFPKEQYEWLKRYFNNCDASKIGSHIFGGIEGAAMFDGKNWRVFQELLNSDLGVQMILTIPDGTVWFAMSMNGIYSYDGKSWRHYTKSGWLDS